MRFFGWLLVAAAALLALLPLASAADPPPPAAGFFKRYYPGLAPMQTDLGILINEGKSVRVKKSEKGEVLGGPFEKDLGLTTGEMLLAAKLTIDDNGSAAPPPPVPGTRPHPHEQLPVDKIVAVLTIYMCCGTDPQDGFHRPASLNIRRGDFKLSSGHRHAANDSTIFYLPFRINPHNQAFAASGMEIRLTSFGVSDMGLHELTVETLSEQRFRKQVKGLATGPAMTYDFVPASSHRMKHSFGREVRVPAEDLGFSLARHFDYAHAAGVLEEDETTQLAIAGWHQRVGEGGNEAFVTCGPYSKLPTQGKLVPATVYLRLGGGSGVDNGPDGGGVILDRVGSKALSKGSYAWLGWAGHIFRLQIDVFATLAQAKNVKLVLQRREMVTDDFRRVTREERVRRLKAMKREKNDYDRKNHDIVWREKLVTRLRAGAGGALKGAAAMAAFDEHYNSPASKATGDGKLVNWYHQAYRNALLTQPPPPPAADSGAESPLDLADTFHLTEEELADVIDESLEIPPVVPVHFLFRPPSDDALIEIRVKFREGSWGQVIHLATTIGLPPVQVMRDEDKSEKKERTREDKEDNGESAGGSPSPSPDAPAPSPSAPAPASPSTTPSATPSRDPAVTPSSTPTPPVNMDNLFNGEFADDGSVVDPEEAQQRSSRSKGGRKQTAMDRLVSTIGSASKRVGLDKDEGGNDSDVKALKDEKERLQKALKDAAQKEEEDKPPKPQPSPPAEQQEPHEEETKEPHEEEKPAAPSKPTGDRLKIITRTKQYRLEDGTLKTVTTKEKQREPKEPKEEGHDGEGHRDGDGGAGGDAGAGAEAAEKDGGVSALLRTNE